MGQEHKVKQRSDDHRWHRPKRGLIPLGEKLVPVNTIKAVFREPIEGTQEQLAFACIQKHRIDPQIVLSWVTDEQVRVKMELWCDGKGYRRGQEKQTRDMTEKDPLLEQDEELINALIPHIKQIDLARILAIKRYQHADEETRQTLVDGYYRRLTQYLGPRRNYRRDLQGTKPLVLPALPKEIFEDGIITEILLESEREALIPFFNKSIELGLQYLEERMNATTDPLQTRFLEELQEYVTKVIDFNVPGFKKQIAGTQKDLPEKERFSSFTYPSYHQREYAYRFIHKPDKKVDLLIGDTGTMKTGMSIYAMEAAGAKTTLVICPAGVRDNWKREIDDKYANPVSTLVIKNEKDLRKAMIPDTRKRHRYIVMGYSLLSTLKLPESERVFEQIVSFFGIDSLIADEVHLTKEPDTNCTQQLYTLSSKLGSSAPRISMTATGVVNIRADLDGPIHILLPDEYKNEGDFTKASRGDPHLIAALLRGRKILTRVTAESILGDELPPTDYQEVLVPMSPFHQAVYEYVYLDDTAEGMVKRGMLRQAALDPALMKKYYHPDQIRKHIEILRKKGEKLIDEQAKSINKRRIEALYERLTRLSGIMSPQEALKELKQAYNTYTRWVTQENPQEVFNEDFLITIGHHKLAIWAFFNYPDGVHNLIQQSPIASLKKDWHGKEIFSSKYIRLKQILDQVLATGKAKVLIFSGFYMAQVTLGSENVKLNKELGISSLCDYLRKWYGEDVLIRIDGTVGLNAANGRISPREMARLKMRLDPHIKIALSTQRANRLGIDLTIPSTRGNEGIERVCQIHLDRPDTYADVIQTIGRSRRPGQKKPLSIISLHLTNGEYPTTKRYGLFDSGIEEDLEFKRLIGQEMLDGIPLTEEEEQFMGEHTADMRINAYPITPRTYLYRRFFPDIRGKGAQKNKEYMGRVGYEGMTNADFFSSYYPQYDLMGITGHNIKVVASIIERFREQTQISEPVICDVGAGAGALQLTLGQPITNVDIMHEMLQIASKRLLGKGTYLENEASDLKLPTDSFDVTNSSFMLHWTANREISIVEDVGYTSERAQVLCELNRVTKPGGLITITVPAGYLTERQFIQWKEALEKHFGFKLHGQFPSGLVKAVDYKTEPVSWMFNLVKVGTPRLGKDFSIHTLEFQFEQDVTISTDRVKKHKKGEAVSPPQPIPHSEFEVWRPDDGTNQKITYKSRRKTREEVILHD